MGESTSLTKQRILDSLRHRAHGGTLVEPLFRRWFPKGPAS